MSKIALIVAMDKNRGIGKNNDLLWHLPADMAFFKETTMGQIVVMGRKNFESIPERFRPLQGRENAILTRNNSFTAPNCTIFHSLESCLKHYENDERTIFIIGGGEIYKQALEANIISEMYITEVATELAADTFFPEIDSSAWMSEIVLEKEKDERNPFDFTVCKYLRKD